jgi:hypothetical protein
MFYQQIDPMVDEWCFNQVEIVLLINLQKLHKVNIWYIQAPGPGNYRLPSDFGIYDHLNGACGHKGGFT